MSAVALLDVNVLIALFFPDHVHHQIAHDWFADHRRAGWATCATTENGFIRVAVQQPFAGGVVVRPIDAAAHLRRLCASREHRFWQEGVSLLDEDLFAPEYVAGHRQITDIYLLGLAFTMGGCLATFDRTIPVEALVGARRDVLQVIAPVGA